MTASSRPAPPAAPDCHDDGGLAVDASMRTVALLGSPNAGKTTLFNALTGSHARTANYPGVTVTYRAGVIGGDRNPTQVLDLPGTYSLVPVSPDEQVVIDALSGAISGVPVPDALLIVIDATTIARSLLLVAEGLALGLPTMVVATMVDELSARGGSLDTDRLSAALGVPVHTVVGHKRVGVDALADALVDPDAFDRPLVAPPSTEPARSQWASSVTDAAYSPPRPDERSLRIDSVLLHPVFGSLIFVAVMAAFFQTIFTLAAPIVDWLDGQFASLGGWVQSNVGGLLGRFLAEGIVGGVGGVIVFVPQIALLFFLLALMEKSGYLARAALLADRVMATFGLEGRSFVSMLSSFACAVPGIMSTRTIPDERTRIATMMSAPLMTCSARLPVFTLLVSAFVPTGRVLGPFTQQGLVMLGLYVLGAASGLIYAGVLNRIGLRATPTAFFLELPPYRMPRWSAVARSTWTGASGFLRKAGTIILLTSVGLWVLLNVPQSKAPVGSTKAEAAAFQMQHSVAGRIGTAITPVFKPLGFEWRTNVALIGSLAAREVFVSTLSITTATQDEAKLGSRLTQLRDANGRKVFDAPTVAAMLVFFVYALQCLSTVAVLRRETNSWKWPAIAMSSMFVLAYVGALIAHTIVAAIA